MFLNEPPQSRQVKSLFERDEAENGFVMNLTHLWAWRPDVMDSFSELRRTLTDGSSLTLRELAVLVCATARALGDAYCALAWGERLARDSSIEVAARLFRTGACWGLTKREKELANWANLVVTNPNAVSRDDVDALRAAGFNEKEIFEATAWIAFRMAFSTVNDALGTRPDAELAARTPAEVRRMISFGRPVAAGA